MNLFTARLAILALMSVLVLLQRTFCPTGSIGWYTLVVSLFLCLLAVIITVVIEERRRQKDR